jgi:hypothetical protein
MTSGEKQAARAGFLDWLSDELAGQSVNRNTVATKFAEVPRFQQMVRELFPDQGAVNDFLGEAAAQARFGRTRNLVTGGSPTARIQQDVAGLSPGLVQSVVDAGVTPGGAVAGALRLIKGNTTLSPDVVDELQKILFNPNIIPKDLKQNMASRAFNIPRLPPAQAAGAAGGLIGSQQAAAGDILGVLGINPEQHTLGLLDQEQK